ncbi:MAG TPA: peptidylprolyl isomerase, partial [Terriglobales bacterium]|nr:peptidylprolyl isomerase [Terriglobales bacterium]
MERSEGSWGFGNMQASSHMEISMQTGNLWQSARELATVLFLCGVCFLRISYCQTSTSSAISLQIIVVGSPAEAQQILERLKRGGDFAALAKEKSIDPTADDGGNMGKLDPSTLRLELREALQGVAPGQTTKAVKIPSGYAILKVLPENEAQERQRSQALGMSPTANLSLAGRGSIRFPPDVAGAVDAEVTFGRFPKPDGWNRDLRTICALRRQAVPTLAERLEKFLAPANQANLIGMRPMDIMQGHYGLALLNANQGNMDAAIEQWQIALGAATPEIPQSMLQLTEVLGIAYLHKSEMENDIYHIPGDRCIFPLRQGSQYQKTASSNKAIEYFLKYLEQKPDELEVKWLLNLAYMTLGKYPAGVPPKFLIPPAAFESKEDIGRFVDVAPAAGLNSFSLAGGVIVEDFENNGLLDVVTSSSDACESLHYFHNNGDGTFFDRTAQAGLADQLGGLNTIQADYNNDGCMDILVPRGAWQTSMPMSLLRNNCDGTFTDVTRE